MADSLIEAAMGFIYFFFDFLLDVVPELLLWPHVHIGLEISTTNSEYSLPCHCLRVVGLVSSTSFFCHCPSSSTFFLCSGSHHQSMMKSCCCCCWRRLRKRLTNCQAPHHLEELAS